MLQLTKRFDLQTKISFILVAVILPTFLVVTIAQHQITLPILEEDIRQLGVTSGKTLAAEIGSLKLLNPLSPTDPRIESSLQSVLDSQPNITRIDILARDPVTGIVKTLASNVEEEPGAGTPVNSLVDSISSELKSDEEGNKSWEITAPIETHSRDSRGPKRLLGNVRILISTDLISRLATTLWKISASAAALSVVCLILALRYFLRKMIANDRLLRQAENQNLQLSEQLHEVQRQLLNSEKLAVMGQLTASLAHEIGTPLNAIGGHLQLLKDEISGIVQASEGKNFSTLNRVAIMSSQLDKIENTVQSFLQSTSKPNSQKQLVDLNRLIDKTLGIIHPQIESLGIRLKRDFDQNMGPLRLVPIDMEQLLLNLLNNSIDSIQAKNRTSDRVAFHLELSTTLIKTGGRDWARILVFDRGEGIKKANLPQVFKPFFTTKRPGEGTGLGLTICQKLAHKYGGELEIDAKEGAWTRVSIKLPYNHAST